MQYIMHQKIDLENFKNQMEKLNILPKKDKGLENSHSPSKRKPGKIKAPSDSDGDSVNRDDDSEELEQAIYRH